MSYTDLIGPGTVALALIDFQPAMFQGVPSHELQQNWARSGTSDGAMNVLKDLTPYGVQVRYANWALGEDASEAGHAAAAAE